MQENTPRNDTAFDIVVWGATGFTGSLVVEYLLQQYPPTSGLRWAVAGRSRQKLQSLLDELIDNAEHPPIIVADSHDPQTLDALVSTTKVVISTVGPYAKYGSELVAACVRSGTDYCDLCGEVQWMRRMIDLHQTQAVATGARIVMSCGFDSIPSDFGAWYLQREARRIHGKACDNLVLLVRAMQGGASGGTFASMLYAIEAAKGDRSIARILLDPYALNPEGDRDGPDGRDQTRPAFNSEVGAWTAPFVMASVNTRVVRRSNALLGGAYGERFRYHEAVLTGTGFKGRFKATLVSLGLRAFLVASVIPLTRKWIVQKLLPSPGEGPSKHARENGFFNLLLIGAVSADAASAPHAGTRQSPLNESVYQRTMRLRIKGDRDPGYGSTSKMLAESALCLALDPIEVGGGCWTPVTAMGELLLQRLTTNAGLSFTLEA